MHLNYGHKLMFTIVLENMKLNHFFLLSTWVENVFPCGFRVVSVCVLSNPHQMCNFPMGSSYFPVGSFKIDKEWDLTKLTRKCQFPYGFKLFPYGFFQTNKVQLFSCASFQNRQGNTNFLFFLREGM